MLKYSNTKLSYQHLVLTFAEDSVRITDTQNFDKHSMAVLEYMATRNLNFDDTDYYYPIRIQRKTYYILNMRGV